MADYVVVKKQLRISATSTNPEATLTAYVTSTDVLIGTLTKKSGRYTGQFKLRTNPQNITVKSSLGGTASKVVIAR